VTVTSFVPSLVGADLPRPRCCSAADSGAVVDRLAALGGPDDVGRPCPPPTPEPVEGPTTDGTI
jgi:hypothetical protein